MAERVSAELILRARRLRQEALPENQIVVVEGLDGLEMSKLKEARSLLDEACALSPETGDPFAERAFICLLFGDFEQMKRDAVHSISCPNLAEEYQSLVSWMIQRGTDPG